MIERSVGVVCNHAGYLYGETNITRDAIHIGGSEKLLGAYFDGISASIEGLRNAKRTISFDFYDTLFTRLAARPEDVQSYVGHQLKSEQRIAQEDDFLHFRKDAESAARKHKKIGDVGLDEIYAAFPKVCHWSADTIERARQLELKLEMKTLLPRESVVALCRQFAASKIRLLLISDTYMSASFIGDVLEQYGLRDLFDEIHCSSETGMRKDSGEVWKWLSRQLAENSVDFAHVGDNEHSDIQKATDQGLSALGILNTAVLADLRGCPMPTGWRHAESDWKSGILLGPLIARLGNDPFNPPIGTRYTFKDSRDFGYAVLGPLVFAFTAWLARTAKHDRTDHLYFLSRGGYFLHQVYTAVEKESNIALPTASYLFVSRRATLPAAFAVKPDPNTVVSGVGGYQGSLGDMLRARMGIPSEILNPALSNRYIKLPEDRASVEEMIRSQSEALRFHCANSARMLKNYLAQEGMENAKRAGVVDLGYSATIQKSLQRLLQRPLAGYYFGIAPAAQQAIEEGGFVSACFGEEKIGTPLPDIIKCSILLESFFAAPTGQVDGYVERGGQVFPVYTNEPESGEAYSELELAAQGMRDYCLDLVRAYGGEVLLMEIQNSEALKPLLGIIDGWAEIPAALRRGLLVDDDFCGNGVLDALAIVQRTVHQERKR